jgi:hypothetical protein
MGMEPKAAVILVITVETARLRWFVAALGLNGPPVPLLCSEVGDLEKYASLNFDEQIAFLRHRFCGVMQRGCDRLWALGMKACQFVILFDGFLADSTGRLTHAVADHMAQWMLNPPLIVFNLAGTSRPSQPAPLENLAGHMERPLEHVLFANLGELHAACLDLSAWELIHKKKE